MASPKARRRINRFHLMAGTIAVLIAGVYLHFQSLVSSGFSPLLYLQDKAPQAPTINRIVDVDPATLRNDAQISAGNQLNQAISNLDRLEKTTNTRAKEEAMVETLIAGQALEIIVENDKITNSEEVGDVTDPHPQPNTVVAQAIEELVAENVLIKSTDEEQKYVLDRSTNASEDAVILGSSIAPNACAKCDAMADQKTGNPLGSLWNAYNRAQCYKTCNNANTSCCRVTGSAESCGQQNSLVVFAGTVPVGQACPSGQITCPGEKTSGRLINNFDQEIIRPGNAASICAPVAPLRDFSDQGICRVGDAGILIDQWVPALSNSGKPIQLYDPQTGITADACKRCYVQKSYDLQTGVVTASTPLLGGVLRQCVLSDGRQRYINPTKDIHCTAFRLPNNVLDLGNLNSTPGPDSIVLNFAVGEVIEKNSVTYQCVAPANNNNQDKGNFDLIGDWKPVY